MLLNAQQKLMPKQNQAEREKIRPNRPDIKGKLIVESLTHFTKNKYMITTKALREK